MKCAMRFSFLFSYPLHGSFWDNDVNADAVAEECTIKFCVFVQRRIRCFVYEYTFTVPVVSATVIAPTIAIVSRREHQRCAMPVVMFMRQWGLAQKTHIYIYVLMSLLLSILPSTITPTQLSLSCHPSIPSAHACTHAPSFCPCRIVYL
jgi:hypothetical protein